MDMDNDYLDTRKLDKSSGKMLLMEKLEYFFPYVKDLIEKRYNAVAKFLLKSAKVQLTHLVDDTGSTLLHYAVKCNNFEIVCDLVCLGYKSDMLNDDGVSPLSLAFMHNRAHMVEILIRGINVSEKNLKLLLTSIMLNREKVCSKVVQLLLKECRYRYAEDEALAKLLMETHCLLYDAVLLNNTRIVRIMVDNGHCVNIENPNNGNHPLHIAVALGNFGLVRLLIENNADVNAMNFKNEIPLNHQQSYITSKDFKILEVLIQEGSLMTTCDNSDRLQIFKIFQHKNNAAVKLLLQYIDWNVQDGYGDTVLHYCARIIAPREIIAILSMFSSDKFNPNIQNNSGETPLHLLAFRYCRYAMRSLLKRGADINIRMHNHVTVLHIVIAKIYRLRNSRKLNVDFVFELLIDHGADIQYVTDDEKTILDEIEEHDATSGIILTYLALLEEQGTITYAIRRKINSTYWIKKHIEFYKLQLQLLKNVKVYESISLYHLMIASKIQIKSYLRNKQLARKLRHILSSSNHGAHWMQVYILKKRIVDASCFTRWQQKAAISFCNLVDSSVRFADLIFSEVVGYLSTEDVKNLAAVKCLDQYPSEINRKRKRQ